MCQRARAFRRFGGARDETVDPVSAPGIETPLDQAERTGYLADQVVEVVRDPAGELTQCLDLLRLMQILAELGLLLLGLLVRAQILKTVDGTDQRAAIVEDRCDIDQNRHA